ncbi:MAG TPA: cytochrome b N-terminal domain-containing protein [Verrucomicrobiae bacterium]|jgi:ubiquinol-cytochrome c reductase cytochrome b subunit|nr:cytochrome b N-terminal domain-containing protein [Verrucomicrobiae bacterium]
MFKRIFHRVRDWVDDRTGLPEMIGKTARHLVPPDAKWWYVFGSATLCAFMVQVVTGIALAFSYIPSASEAYSTLHFISNEAPFGHFLRGLHYYGASAMVLMVGLHMAQVFLAGSYKFPRELNWATGVLLLGFTLVMGFTGQLLRGDQNAVWTVVVAAEQAGRVPFIGQWLAHFILGGDTVGGATFTRFFAIHVFIMPGFIFAFVGLHLWLVLRHGISEPPKPGKLVDPKTYRQEYKELIGKKGKPFWPDSAWRDVVFCVGMIIVIAALALFSGAPQLGKPPDPSIIDATPRPDWYFMWYFAMLALLPHGTEHYLLVYGPLLVGTILIALPFFFNRGERSPWRRPWAISIVLMTVVMIATLWMEGVKSPWSPNFKAQPLSASVVGATNGPVFLGAQLFHDKGCLNCHLIGDDGGRRGPDLSEIGDRLSKNQMVLRIANGAVNMPAYAGNLKPTQMDALVAFLQSRNTERP